MLALVPGVPYTVGVALNSSAGTLSGPVALQLAVSQMVRFEPTPSLFGASFRILPRFLAPEN